MPAASTIVPASIVSSASWTRPGSIARTGRRRADVGAASLQHACRHVGELRDRSPAECAGRPRTDGSGSRRADARVVAQHVVGECGELAEQLDADEPAADHDDREAAAPRRRVGRRVGSLELFDQVISQHQRVRHRLERQRVSRAGNQLLVRRRAERDDEVVVRHVVLRSLRATARTTALDVDTFDGRLDETRAAQRGADRLRAVPQLELPEHASNSSGVMTKKFSRLTSVIATSRCPRSARSRWRAVATPPNPPPSTTTRTVSSRFRYVSQFEAPVQQPRYAETNVSSSCADENAPARLTSSHPARACCRTVASSAICRCDTVAERTACDP